MMKALVFALLLAPAAAFAQDPASPANALGADPIGALIDQQQETTDVEPAEDVAEDAAEAASAATPAAPMPYVPRPYVPPVRPALDRPSMIHETGVAPDGPPELSQQVYESRVRGSIAAAQGLQGPLDGAWSLTDVSGTKLYTLQMVDPANGVGLEGAWRDLRRTGIGDVGIIDEVQRSAGALSLRFSPRAGETVAAELTPTAGGGWSGRLTERGAAIPVTLVREGPQAAGYAVLGATPAYSAPRPYDSTPRYAPVRKASAKATAKKGGKGKATAKKKASSKKKAPAKRKKRA